MEHILNEFYDMQMTYVVDSKGILLWNVDRNVHDCNQDVNSRKDYASIHVMKGIDGIALGMNLWETGPNIQKSEIVVDSARGMKKGWPVDKESFEPSSR